MTSTTSPAVPERIRLAAGAVIGVIGVAVIVYCLLTVELMLVIPPAIAALTAGASVAGSIGPRLQSRVARAAAAIAVPIGFASAAIVMITVMMRVMYHANGQLGVTMLSAFGMSTNRFSAPFWLATAASAALYATDAEVGPQRLAATSFSVAVLATAMAIAALYL